MISWIALNMTPGVGPRAATKLLEKFGSADGVFHATRDELRSLRLRPETIESILAKDLHEKAEREFEEVKKLGADVLILDDGSYPALLKEIPDPPIVLYVKGNWQQCLEAPCIGIVGSRRCSTYGENASLMLSRDLAERGVTIVSGFARGIDTAGHKGALQAGGKTVAVFGTGIDAVYPKENSKFADELLAKGGALISQFPLGTPPLKDNFPYRNRVISGISMGVIVVEGSDRSGSLITARLALEQGREVFAVPGNITSSNSYGPNYLIKSAGAKLVQQWQDVVSELPPEISAEILPPKLDKIDKKDTDPSKEKIPSDLTDHEAAVWKLLSLDANIHIDELVATTGFSIGELSTALLALEIRDLIRALPGKCYARKI
jgi:DNA processing protein